jgi:hypothetical protein
VYDVAERCNMTRLMYWGTYLVETNISVQTMKTSIYATRSWFNWELMRGGRGDLQISKEVGEVICKGAFEIYSSHLLWMLPRSISCGSDWSFHSLHGEVGFHLICCLIYCCQTDNTWLEQTNKTSYYDYIDHEGSSHAEIIKFKHQVIAVRNSSSERERNVSTSA